jgi:arylsulfatase A-like enzyme
MISRMDRDIGRILELLKELKLDRNTIVMFSSDNGPTFNGGTDSKFFQSAGPLRDLKTSVYEGGIRVPLIARWPGKIQPNTVSDHVSAFWDFAPTVADLVGKTWPEKTDGISFMPELLGKPQPAHEYLYWEFSSGGGRQAMRMGDWKSVRVQAKQNPNGPLQLFNLAADIGESMNVAADHPELVAKFAKKMSEARTPSVVRSWNYLKSER